MNKLYNKPLYYHIAFSWDISYEINNLKELFKKHVPFKVKDILEPACGSGRFLLSLPKHDFYITGYDCNIKMINYTKDQIKKADLTKFSKIEFGNMITKKFNKKFDAAFNLINSIGYLINDNDIISHLKNTAYSLNKNSIYIIQLNCVKDNFNSYDGGTWEIEKNNIKVKSTWCIEKEDNIKKLSYQRSIMEINDNGKKFIIEDEHILRAWTYHDIKKLVKKSKCFRIEAIYNEDLKNIPLNTNICGKMGNLYYILQVI